MLFTFGLRRGKLGPGCSGTIHGVVLATLFVAAGCELGCKPAADAATAGHLGLRAGQTALENSAAAERRVAAVFSVPFENGGIDFSHQNGSETGFRAILEALGGGVGVLDYDRDGRFDLFFPGGGKLNPDQTVSGVPPVLYRNQGDWRFERVKRAGVDQGPYFNHGCAAADYDNDGFTDVLMTGYGGLQLFHNEGDGTFLECRLQAGLDDPLWSSSATWADLNGDGCLDVYVAHYANWSFANHPFCSNSAGIRDNCQPQQFDPLPHFLYFSEGDGGFREVSAASGLRMDGRGMGAIAADFDHDGDVDLYVANDTTDNFLYLNDGQGVFKEEGLMRGVALDDSGRGNASMGLELFDFDGDGWSDLWVTNYVMEMYALYINQGGGQFEFSSHRTGLGALGAQYVGWGTVALDIDRDGDEDLLVVNGHAIYHPSESDAPRAQLPLLLQNDRRRGQLHKVDFSPTSYWGSPHTGRGLALGDLDDDGDLDLVVCNADEPATLLRNDSSCEGKSVRARLVGRSSNRDAIGARLVLHTSAGDQLRHVKAGASYASTSDLCVDWGVAPTVQISGLTIVWPSGIVQEIADLPTGRVICIVEPESLR